MGFKLLFNKLFFRVFIAIILGRDKHQHEKVESVCKSLTPCFLWSNRDPLPVTQWLTSGRGFVRPDVWGEGAILIHPPKQCLTEIGLNSVQRGAYCDWPDSMGFASDHHKRFYWSGTRVLPIKTRSRRGAGIVTVATLDRVS